MYLALAVGIAWAQSSSGEPAAWPPPAAPVAEPAPPSAPPPSAPVATASPPAPAAGPTTAIVDRVAAVVNDEVILLSEVYEFADYIRDQQATGVTLGRAEREVIERLIERTLVKQEVARLNLEVTDQEVDRAIDDVARRNGLDRAQLRAEVERGGYTWDGYRGELRDNLQEMKFGQTVLRPRVNISENELKDAFLRSTASAPQEAHVLAIFLAPTPDGDAAALLARATEIVSRARAGEDFAALSKAFDQGPFGAQGGEMGRFRPGELVAALDGAVTATPTGGVSDPVVTDNGVFVLKVAERVTAGGDYEAMKAELADQVFQTRMVDEQQRWFQQARRQAAIRILIPEAAAALP